MTPLDERLSAQNVHDDVLLLAKRWLAVILGCGVPAMANKAAARERRDYLTISFAVVASLYGQQMKTAEKEPKGVIGRSHKDGLPVIWKFISEAPTSQKRAALPWLTVISWKYDGSTNNGMPPKAGNDRMIALEQTIERR